MALVVHGASLAEMQLRGELSAANDVERQEATLALDLPFVQTAMAA